MKKSTTILLTIVPLLLLSGCSEEEEVRDVYKDRDECRADWGDDELCEPMNDEDSDRYRKHGGVFYPHYIYGPRYYPSDRSVIYKGNSRSPSSSKALSSPSIRSYSSSARTSGVSSPSRTGGFGGRSTSGGT